VAGVDLIAGGGVVDTWTSSSSSTSYVLRFYQHRPLRGYLEMGIRGGDEVASLQCDNENKPSTEAYNMCNYYGMGFD
jgi:hypothetical protein